MLKTLFLVIATMATFLGCHNPKQAARSVSNPSTLIHKYQEVNQMKQDSISGYAPVNGLNMYYEIHGEGNPLVLIHGGGSTIQTTFGHILPMLRLHYKVIAVELQAHGRTSAREGASTFEQDADDVAALLRHLKINNAHIFGFSNGGNTAMQMAIRHPGLVNKLVVVSSFYKRDGMMPGFFDFMKNATLENMPMPLKTAFLDLTHDEKMLEVMHNKDRDRMLAFHDWDEKELAKITVPTLIVSADKDVVRPEHAIEMSRKIPTSELMILPGTHGSFIGEICAVEPGSKVPEMTVGLIRAFLDK